jgi:hypothetical protein
MSIDLIKSATESLGAWVKTNGQSIGYDSAQCHNLSAHSCAAVEAMTTLSAKNFPSMG